eukprot:g3361.t1
MATMLNKIPMWLDCDPGHDDAMAIILAGCHPEIELLGISTVSGNQEISKVTSNALRVVTYAGLKNIEVYEGIGKPLLAETIHVPEIHGKTGMDTASDSNSSKSDFNQKFPVKQTKNPQKAVFALRDAILANSHSIVRVICTGPLTNMAVFLTLFPELINKIEVVCMGGAIGLGNLKPAAEFNFLADAHAASLVFRSGVKLVMIPLEVTHLALFTHEVEAKMFSQEMKTKFQTFVLQVLLFFANAYKDVYGMDYPAIHDPCAVYYALRPEHFEVKEMHVEIDTESRLCFGRSVCDVYGISGLPPNCHVGTSMKAEKFWDCMIQAVNRANTQSPLNQQ